MTDKAPWGTYETDFAIDILCDHAGRDCEAEPRLVTTIYRYRETFANGEVFEEWREALHPEPGYPYALQTFYGEAQRLLAPLETEQRDEILRDQKRLAGLMSARSRTRMCSERWRFWCQDCGLTEPLRGDTLAPVLAKLGTLGWTSANIDVLVDLTKRT